MDKCFCHLNGYAVKDATARSYYRILELPLGELMISTNNESKNFDLTEVAQLESISNFINEVAKSITTKPLFKIVNTSFITSGEGTINTDCTEILFTTCVTDIKATENVFMFYGFIQTSENDKWNVKLVVMGEWINGVFTATTVKIFFTKQSTAGGSVDLTGYATTDYVDDAIANIDIPEGGGGSSVDAMPVVHNASNNVSLNGGVLDSACLTQLAQIINKYENEGKSFPGFVLTSGTTAHTRMFYRVQNNQYDSSKWQFKTLHYEVPLASQPNKLNFGILTLTVSGNSGNRSVSAGSFTTQSESIIIIDANNSYAFTPTNNYHPATKKYVDDSLSNKVKIVTGTLTQATGTTNGECYITLPSGYTYSNCVVASAYYINPSSGYKIFEKALGCIRSSDNQGMVIVDNLTAVENTTTYECGLVLIKL